MTADTKIKLTCLTCGAKNALPADRVTANPKCGTCGDALADGKVSELRLDELERAVRSDDLPIIVDLWAPWCGPCRAMAPEFTKAASEMKGRVRFVKINTDQNPDAAVRYSIRGIPALLLFNQGREHARRAGAQRAPELMAWINQALG